MQQKILIFIVAYNAEAHLGALLTRLAESYLSSTVHKAEVLLIDDASTDATHAVAREWMRDTGIPLTVLKNPVNQGYGGNQRIGYTYALERGFDAVVLLHGDGQYPPEKIEALLAPLLAEEADAVFGSRMLRKRDALNGGMPLYKFCANILLTKFQNLFLRTKLSEYHSGFRAYRVTALRQIPFRFNSTDFSFDSEIIIQLLDQKLRIREIPIPTRYGDEICHVNGIKYAAQVVRNTLVSRMQRFQCYYSPRFDYQPSGVSPYEDKTAFPSSHRFALEAIAPGSVVLDIGGGSGYVAGKLREKGCRVYGYDAYTPPLAAEHYTRHTALDLEREAIPLPAEESRIDAVLMLDIIEHLSDPEGFLTRLREQLAEHSPKIILTPGNVGFFITRVSLILGQFNYGRKGILDFTHKRLFTFASLARLLDHTGYRIMRRRGIPVPWPLALGNGITARILLALNAVAIFFSRSLFAFQVAIVAEPLPTLEMLLARAHESKES